MMEDVIARINELAKKAKAEGLTPAEARLLMPSRAEFVGLWRYLQRRCAGLGRVEGRTWYTLTANVSLTGQGKRYTGAEKRLHSLILETGPQGVAVSLRQVGRKVDLEASPILGRLRQAIRGGSAEA